MKFFAFVLFATSLLAQPSLVTVTKIYGPSAAQPASGIVTITATASFTASDSVQVFSDIPTVANIVNGQFSVLLEPTPLGISYLATYSIRGAKSFTEVWNVRATSSTLSLNDVRVGTNPFAMIPRGNWTNSDTYGPYNIVGYNGSTYLATAFSTNVRPDTDASKWFLMAAAGGLASGGKPDGAYCVQVTSGVITLTQTGCPGSGGGGGLTLLSLTNSQLSSLTNSQLSTLSN